jgi:hypothetical protein
VSTTISSSTIPQPDVGGRGESVGLEYVGAAHTNRGLLRWALEEPVPHLNAVKQAVLRTNRRRSGLRLQQAEAS